METMNHPGEFTDPQQCSECGHVFTETKVLPNGGDAYGPQFICPSCDSEEIGDAPDEEEDEDWEEEE